MSRTLKDRPYWVKANDKALARDEYHSHEIAGNPIYGSVEVKDENGETVMETYTVYGVTGYFIYDLFQGFKTYPDWESLIKENPQHSDSARSRYTLIGDIEKIRPKREQTIIGYYPDECTIDKPFKGSKEYIFWNTDEEYLCTHALCDWNDAKWGSNERPSKKQRQDFHRSNRHIEKAYFRKVRNEADYDDVDDDMNEDVLLNRQHHHRGWWD